MFPYGSNPLNQYYRVCSHVDFTLGKNHSIIYSLYCKLGMCAGYDLSYGIPRIYCTSTSYRWINRSPNGRDHTALYSLHDRNPGDFLIYVFIQKNIIAFISIFTIVQMQEFPRELSSSCFSEGMRSSPNKVNGCFSQSVDFPSSTESENYSEGAGSTYLSHFQDLSNHHIIPSNDILEDAVNMDAGIIPDHVFITPIAPLTSQIDGNLEHTSCMQSIHDDFSAFSMQSQPNLLSDYSTFSSCMKYFVHLMNSVLCTFYQCLSRELSINFFNYFMRLLLSGQF